MNFDSREGFATDELEAYRAAEENVRQNEEGYCDEFTAWLRKMDEGRDEETEAEEPDECDGDCNHCSCFDCCGDEYDGQPDEHQEWQDLPWGGDEQWDRNDDCDCDF